MGGKPATARELTLVGLLTGLMALLAAHPIGALAATTPGEHWQAARPWENYFGATILQSGRALIVGDKGLVLTSEDQGHTWTRRQLNNSRKFYDLYSVSFTADGQHGWIVGDGGSIFHSDDGGKTWTLQPAKLDAAVLKVAAIDAQKACAVGEHGAVLCTSDAGASWNTQKFDDLVFFDLTFTDPNDGWAVGEFATVIRTTDGGKTWTVQTGAQRTLTADPYFAIAFTDPNDGTVLGLSGANMVTTDGGKTWKTSALNDDSRSFYAEVPVHTDDTTAIYAGGENGVTARVVQDKVEPIHGATSNAITSLAFSPHFAVAVGLSGTIMRSDDNGQHWTLVP
jgi:photosystem II stability/assembly factor-like uncharacterized protein